MTTPDWIVLNDMLNDEIAKNERLQAELTATKEAVFDAVNLAKLFGDEVTELRPWAEVGKRAVLHGWTAELLPVEHREKCRLCGMVDDHAPDCLIPSLLAQLEAAKD